MEYNHVGYADDVTAGFADSYYRDVVDEIIRHIDGGTVCDLGSHALGHYWALGYIERVESYSCYELSPEAIEILTNAIRTLQPCDIEAKYSDLVRYLRDEKIITLPAAGLLAQIASKFSGARQFDFLKDRADVQFDNVLAMESLAVVDDYDQLLTAVGTARSLLKDGGLLYSVCCHHGAVTPYIETMQRHRIAGRLNPDGKMFERAVRQCGFEIVRSKTIPIDFPDYLTATFLLARR